MRMKQDIKKSKITLAGVAQLVECYPMHGKVTG